MSAAPSASTWYMSTPNAASAAAAARASVSAAESFLHRPFVPAQNETMTAMGWFITADVGEFLAEAGVPAPTGRNSVVRP